MKTYAKLHYSDIRAADSGCYVWLNPDERSTLAILRLLRGAPFKAKDGTELHCTIVHSTRPLPRTLDVPLDQAYSSLMTHINLWEDHKNRLILTAGLDSDDLRALHENLTSQGLAHSYPEYNPHITLAKDLLMDAQQRLWLTETNERLSKRPLTITFSPQLRGSPVA